MLKLFRYLKPYVVIAVISPLLMIGEVAADLLLPFLMSFIVNFGIEGMDMTDPEHGSLIANKIVELFCGSDYSRMDIIVTFGVLMLVITLVGGCFGVLCAWTAAKAAQSFGNDLRCDAYRKVMSLSIEQTDKFTTGSLVTRMTNDIAQIVEFVEMLLRGFVRAPMFIAGGIVMLLALNVQFTMILMCSVPVLIIVIVLVLRKAIPLYGIVQKKLDGVNSVVQENVSGARVVKAYVCEGYECDRFERANSGLRNVNYSVLKTMAIIHPVLTVLMNFSVIAVIYIGGFNISIGAAGMTTGSIMAGVSYMTQIIFSVMMVTNMFQSISRANASARRVKEVLLTEPVVTKREDAKEGADQKEADETFLTFSNVAFRYPGTNGKPILQDINLSIKKGETFAIIGATGSGKTSLISMLPRFYDPIEGTICLNGKDISTYELDELRSKIGYVMQKSELFSDTVENNIRWGNKDADLEMVKEAARAAQAASFVERMPEGYQSYIAEKGASLSGGQKQRLCIARALLRKPEILILDDSTSALDLATESALRKSYKELLTDTTVIMIAQRIASVMEADRIAVIENDGTIKYCDSHEELLKKSDTYRDIYESQMQSDSESTPATQTEEKGGAR